LAGGVLIVAKSFLPRETAQTGALELPGPAPPGKVWSAEHGHWHDVSAVGDITLDPIPLSQTPQPEGPILPGKVWSDEHSHLHDVPPRPEGPTPPGKVWSDEHSHWHDASPQPEGPAPAGQYWSAEHGHWHSYPTGEAAADSG
jgi:hypothetical protein